MDLVEALEKAASAVPGHREAGEAALQSMQLQSGFFAALLDVFGAPQLPSSSRVLAIIFLKNNVERHWRQPATWIPGDKALARARLLERLRDPATVGQRTLAKQLAAVVARIARHDYPRFWPELLMQLHQTVLTSAQAAGDGSSSGGGESAAASNGEAGALLEAALETMHQTLKRLGSSRIGHARVKLNEFSVTEIGVYWQVWAAFASYTALKIVGTLLITGHERAHRFDGTKQVFPALLDALHAETPASSIPGVYRVPRETVVKRIGKVFERLLERHPLVFCGFGDASAAVARSYCAYLTSRPPFATSDVGRSGGPLVQGMNIVRDLTRVAKTADLVPTSLPLNLRPRDDADGADREAAYAVCVAVFTPAVVAELTDALITHYFVMTDEDAELWRDDPVDFVVEEARQNAEFSVVLCAELLFAHLLRAWPQAVAPQSQQLVEAAVSGGEPRQVEAALRALQFGAATFAHSFDVEPIIEMIQANANAKANPASSGGDDTLDAAQFGRAVVRRRLCLVAAGWIPVHTGETRLPELSFALVMATLRESWDIVVRLGALELVRVCCDDLDFRPEQFVPAAEDVLTAIYALLREPEQAAEVKMQVLAVLGTVIDGMGRQLSAEDTQRIVEILPWLWHHEFRQSNHHLVQGSVLQTLTHLVAANPQQGESVVYRVSSPLMDTATDPQQPVSQFLLDDGLKLWQALLVNASVVELPRLTPMFERLVDLLASRTEYLGTLLGVLESYAWLDHRVALPLLDRLFGLLALYLANAAPLDESLLVLMCVETLWLAAMTDGAAANASGAGAGAAQQDDAAMAALSAAMQQSGLQQWMYTQVMTAAEPGAQIPMTTLFLAGKALSTLSLMSIASQGRALQLAGADLHAVMPAWASLVSGIADPRDRKLAAMGLAAACAGDTAAFAANGGVVLRVLSETAEEVPDAAPMDYVGNSDEHSTAEELRKRARRAAEPAITLGLRQYTAQVASVLPPDAAQAFASMGLA